MTTPTEHPTLASRQFSPYPNRTVRTPLRVDVDNQRNQQHEAADKNRQKSVDAYVIQPINPST
jgi:hypothetical protein